MPAFESPFFGRPGFAPPIRPENLPVAQALRENGYAVVDFPDPDFAARAAAIRADLDPRYDWAEWRASGFARGDGLRIQDAWTFNDDVKAIACNPALLALLSDLFGRQAQPFQTLNFPVGTQQHFHSDAAHFNSRPERFMCGVWVALEDIEADAGPLVYYPGTHTWPVFDNEHLGTTALGRRNVGLYGQLWSDLVTAHGLSPERFLARKGQALIWAANILHGGDRQTNPDRTRWSQVTHYFFEDCAYYTPFYSDPFSGSIAWREPVDIRTRAPMVNRVGGQPVDAAFIEESSERSGRLLAGESAAIASRVAALRQEVAYHSGRVDRLKSSLSWRITAPIRGVGRLLKTKRA
ncbi:phytanoyl-CoA dioxygenase family protein [Methylobacterium crusticola]|nr:phytanoyl-CoA dioxygenase family protein [Methylobacterium crusticola]